MTDSLVATSPPLVDFNFASATDAHEKTITCVISWLLKMKLRAEISIEIDADDYIAAADHQRSVEMLFGNVKAKYGQASLAIRQMRERQAAAPRARRGEPRHRHHTGNLALYKEH